MKLLALGKRKDDGYFGAWITNEDRRVYDTCLAKVGLNQSLFNSAKLVISIGSFIQAVSVEDSWDKWNKAKDKFRIKKGRKVYASVLFFSSSELK